MRIRTLVAVAALALPLRGPIAQTPELRTLPREVAQEAIDVWNAPATLRVSGPYLVERAREVSGDIAVLGGVLTIAGHVEGRVVGINADIRLNAIRRSTYVDTS